MSPEAIWNELCELDSQELIYHLEEELGDRLHDFTPLDSAKEIRKYIALNHYGGQLDSFYESWDEGEDFDYSPLHPNETVAEFHDHE